ncbi:MAG: GUN4 domain-containing protein [Cyanobacteria bacterium P01_C01_bin.89]
MKLRKLTKLLAGLIGAMGTGVVAIAPMSIAQSIPEAQPEQVPTLEMLEEALTQGNWQRGDELTWEILTGRMDRPDGRRFRQFPCDRLERIDRAWRQASGDRFGFSVQRRLWRHLMVRLGDQRETRQAFDREVGWLGSEHGVNPRGDEGDLPLGYWPREQSWFSGNILRFGCGDEACSFARTVVEEQRPALEYIFPRLSQCRL